MAAVVVAVVAAAATVVATGSLLEQDQALEQDLTAGRCVWYGSIVLDAEEEEKIDAELETMASAMVASAAEGVEVMWWRKCEEEEEGEEEEYEYEEESVNVDAVLSRSSLERAMERAPETAVCITHTTMVLNSRTVTRSTGVYTIV
jgi:hypothetical protein